MAKAGKRLRECECGCGERFLPVRSSQRFVDAEHRLRAYETERKLVRFTPDRRRRLAQAIIRVVAEEIARG